MWCSHSHCSFHSGASTSQLEGAQSLPDGISPPNPPSVPQESRSNPLSDPQGPTQNPPSDPQELPFPAADVADGVSSDPVENVPSDTVTGECC